MCHLKRRKVKNKGDAIIAYHDNDDKAVCVSEAGVDQGLILDCENQVAVEDAADFFLYSGAEAIYVEPA